MRIPHHLGFDMQRRGADSQKNFYRGPIGIRTGPEILARTRQWSVRYTEEIKLSSGISGNDRARTPGGPASLILS